VLVVVEVSNNENNSFLEFSMTKKGEIAEAEEVQEEGEEKG
jgi:hypothetical protein